MRYTTPLALLLCIALAACAGTGEGTNGGGGADVLEDVDTTIPLNEQISRLPGVYLNENGELRIRGAAGPPLVVIDGMQTMSADLTGINPADIERIEVLKGAETSMYGVRGGNGVLVITTKQGSSDAN